jgi:hypothetical protein
VQHTSATFGEMQHCLISLEVSLSMGGELTRME